jgi:hypothetical protein
MLQAQETAKEGKFSGILSDNMLGCLQEHKKKEYMEKFLTIPIKKTDDKNYALNSDY